MRAGWIALLWMAMGCGWTGTDGLSVPGRPGGATVAERNAGATPVGGGEAEEGGFWCLPDSPAGASGECFTSQQECASSRRERGRDGEAPPACEQHFEEAWCRDACDADGQCGSSCFASAAGCEGADAACARTAAPDAPFHPVGSRWWCYAAGPLGHCYRHESSCRSSARQAASDGTVVSGCAVQARAACLVAEEPMRDRFSVDCFASMTDCSFAADRSSRDPDRRIARGCVVWE